MPSSPLRIAPDHEYVNQGATTQCSWTCQPQASPHICANNPGDPELHWREMRFHTVWSIRSSLHVKSLSLPSQTGDYKSKHSRWVGHHLNPITCYSWSSAEHELRENIRQFKFYFNAIQSMKTEHLLCASINLQALSWRSLKHREASAFVTSHALCQYSQQEMHWAIWSCVYFLPTVFSKLKEVEAETYLKVGRKRNREKGAWIIYTLHEWHHTPWNLSLNKYKRW